MSAETISATPIQERSRASAVLHTGKEVVARVMQSEGMQRHARHVGKNALVAAGVMEKTRFTRRAKFNADGAMRAAANLDGSAIKASVRAGEALPGLALHALAVTPGAIWDTLRAQRKENAAQAREAAQNAQPETVGNVSSTSELPSTATMPGGPAEVHEAPLQSTSTTGEGTTLTISHASGEALPAPAPGAESPYATATGGPVPAEQTAPQPMPVRT